MFVVCVCDCVVIFSLSDRTDQPETKLKQQRVNLYLGKEKKQTLAGVMVWLIIDIQPISLT